MDEGVKRQFLQRTLVVRRKRQRGGGEGEEGVVVWCGGGEGEEGRGRGLWCGGGGEGGEGGGCSVVEGECGVKSRRERVVVE